MACKKANIEFEIIDAVDGTVLSAQEISELVYKSELNYLTKSEIGCALSHQKIYKKILEDNLNAAIIMEDDAVICGNVNKLIGNLSDIAKEKKRMVILLQRTNKVYKNRKIVINEECSAYESHNATLAHGYFLTQSAAKTLLKINTPIIKPADAWLSFYLLSFIKVYSLNKDLIKTRDDNILHSLIEKERLAKTIQQEKTLNNIIREKRLYFIIKMYHKILRRPFLQVIQMK